MAETRVSPASRRLQPTPTEPGTAAILFDRVGVSYGRGKKTTHALVDFNLRVAAGETVALLGPSGSGKSTALNALAGFVRPTSGSVRLAGSDVTDLPPARRGIAVVPAVLRVVPKYALEDLALRYLSVELQSPDQVEGTLDLALDLAGDAGTSETGRHAAIVLQLVETLEATLAARELDDLYRRIELPLVPVLAKMEAAGVRIDVDFLFATRQGARRSVPRRGNPNPRAPPGSSST